MGIEFGKNLLTYLNAGKVSASKGLVTTSARAVNPSFKTASYASIPYERAPQVVDTIPTRDAKGNPLLAGYVTPQKTWIA